MGEPQGSGEAGVWVFRIFLWVYGGLELLQFLNSVFEAGLLSHIGFHIRGKTGQFYGMVVFGSIRFGLKVQCAVFGRL